MLVSPERPQRGFLTLAFGNRDYFEMASALISSFRRFRSKTPFAVATDQIDHPALREFDIKVPTDASFGGGVAQKLKLDTYSPFDETLFIDSDCLFYKPPDDLWPLYAPFDDFGVKGWRYLEHEERVPWVNDLQSALAIVGVQRLPNLNGGIYYFRRTDRATAVFEAARNVYHDREILGLRPFKGAPLNDEIAYALAIEKVGIALLPWDNGRAMDMTFEMDAAHAIDISRPTAAFSVHGRSVDPIVVHFNVGAQYSHLYALESAKIRHLRSPVSARIAAGTFFAKKNARRLARRTAEEVRHGSILQTLARRIGLRHA